MPSKENPRTRLGKSPATGRPRSPGAMRATEPVGLPAAISLRFGRPACPQSSVTLCGRRRPGWVAPSGWVVCLVRLPNAADGTDAVSVYYSARSITTSTQMMMAGSVGPEGPEPGPAAGPAPGPTPPEAALTTAVVGVTVRTRSASGLPATTKSSRKIGSASNRHREMPVQKPRQVRRDCWRFHYPETCIPDWMLEDTPVAHAPC